MRMLADLTAVLDVPGPARERLRAAFVRLGKASDHELEVIRLVVREALSSSARLRRIVARFMRGHIPLLLQAIGDGIRDGELDATVPLPAIVLACFGLGALPQIARRAAGTVRLFAGLPGAEKLADLSMQLIYAAVGTRPREFKRGRAR